MGSSHLLRPTAKSCTNWTLQECLLFLPLPKDLSLDKSIQYQFSGKTIAKLSWSMLMLGSLSWFYLLCVRLKDYLGESHIIKVSQCFAYTCVLFQVCLSCLSPPPRRSFGKSDKQCLFLAQGRKSNRIQWEARLG